MKSYKIPNDLLTPSIDKINFIYYENENPTHKVRVKFTQNLISFIIEGEKEIFYSKTPIVIRNKIAVIKKTNCLMTETKNNFDIKYKALLIFFDNEILTNFKVRYQYIVEKLNTSDKSSISVINQDKLLLGYRDYLVDIVKNNSNILSKEIKQIKIEELFLYLLQTYPEKITPILNQNNDDSAVSFKSTIENNLTANLTLNELAFLCNMSVSTFKRHFVKHYHSSPKKWFLNKRMWLAKSQLEKGQKASEIYSNLGYSTLSNFIKAYNGHFKKDNK